MAARRHWRFTVRDQFGFVIQNALVFVYQPATTTAFTGTCYNAVTGGSPITNPFTTNSQGEVEGWFDTAQVVDVLVTDNTDQAYRAVSPTLPISFTSFTEADDIYVSASDVAADPGESGDLVAAIVNPFTAVTAVAGSSGEYADAAHAHPYTALTPAAPVLGRTTAAAGSLTNPARSDHIHPVGATVPRITQFTPAADLTDQSFYSYSIPANTLTAGSAFKFTANLYWTNAATVSGLIFKVRLNTTSGNVVVLGPTWTSTATTHTDTPVDIQGVITVRAIGGSGTILGNCWGQETITVGAGTKTLFSSAIITAVTIDTTASNTLELIGDIQTSNTGINYKVDHAIIEQVA